MEPSEKENTNIRELCKFSQNKKTKAQRIGVIMKKVLWFSRHDMTSEQSAALGDVEITQINRSINSAFELQEEIKAADIIAVVAPINLQQQFLKIAGDKPVIAAVNNRVLVPQEDGSEDKVEFHFVKWERILRIDIVKEDFIP